MAFPPTACSSGGGTGGCTIGNVLNEERAHRRARLVRRLPGLLIVAAAFSAACGGPTQTATPSSAATASTIASTALASPTATSRPSVAPASLGAVPTCQFVAAAGSPASLSDGVASQLQDALNQLQTGGRVPGIQGAVVFPDGSLWTGQAGLAITSSQTQMSADTLMSVGSVSKTFLAALVGRLIQRNALSIDDPLSKYLPGFPNSSNITIRELLNHTSGIQDLFTPLGNQILADPTHVWTPAEVLAGLGKPGFAPGTAYHYSNSDYVALGMVVETLTGKKVADLVRSEFLQPFGLTHTYLQTEETPVGALAHGYMAPISRAKDNSAGAMIPFTAEASAASFSGAYVSTAADLARWASALFGGRVVDQATLANMVDTTVSMSFAAKPKMPYGMGSEGSTIDGQAAWGHRGHLDGFWSAMEYFPGSGITIVLTSNGDWFDPMAGVAALGSIVLPAAPTPAPSAAS